MEDILERMKHRVVVFDGAMGTMIYQKGVFINTCYDELCLTNPDLVSEIHHEYLDAGAEVLETNTFGANRVKLAAFGLADKAAAINRAGAALARAVAGQSRWVAGSVGPCLFSYEQFNPSRAEEYFDAFAEQCAALAEGGVDFIQLETFSHIEEIVVAARAARACGLPVSASVSVNEEGIAADGRTLEDFIRALSLDPNVDIAGINCGIGPAGMLAALERINHLCTKPLVVMPNAGYPQEIGGRTMYLTSPDYFAEYVKRFVQLGARGVGGCCGTTPEHIRRAVAAMRNLGEAREFIAVKAVSASEADRPAVPFEKKSRFAAKLARGEPVTSVEVVPPRSLEVEDIVAKAARCAEAGVDAVNVPDGPRASARLSALTAALIMQERARIEAIPHLTCRDRNLLALQGDLMGAFAVGIRNFLLITGDPPKVGDYPDVTGVFDVDAIGLVQMAVNLNRGHDLAGHSIGSPAAIVVGVAANPCAVDLSREVERFVRKAEAGAEFAITQPVFDPDALLRFLDLVAKRGVDIPVVAGVWPLSSYRNAMFMATQVPGVVVPPNVIERMSRCATKEDGLAAGIEIALEIKARIRPYVRGFQVSVPGGNVETALKVLELA